MNEHDLNELARDVQRNVPSDLRDKCLQIITGFRETQVWLEDMYKRLDSLQAAKEITAPDAKDV